MRNSKNTAFGNSLFSGTRIKISLKRYKPSDYVAYKPKTSVFSYPLCTRYLKEMSKNYFFCVFVKTVVMDT